MSEHQEANKKRLGELITDGYKAAGHTRKSLAPLVGISDRSLYSLEVGERAPRGATQRRLEEALGWARGSVADLLGLGASADLAKVDLEWMRGPKVTAWAGLPAGGTDVIQRLTTAAQEAAALLAEKDRRIHELEQQVAALQSGFDLAADSSPNQGKALRDHLDSVEQENQETA